MSAHPAVTAFRLKGWLSLGTPARKHRKHQQQSPGKETASSGTFLLGTFWALLVNLLCPLFLAHLQSGKRVWDWEPCYTSFRTNLLK